MLKPGDDVMVLPSGFTSKIASIETADGEVDEAFPPMSVTIRLEDEIDVSRGDMICRPHNAPNVAQDIDAMICWMDETQSLQQGKKYTIKHTTRTARTVVKELHYRLDVNTLHRDEGRRLAGAQRDRPGHAAHHRAAVRRRVPPQPDDREVHPGRRGDQPHRRRGHDQRGDLAPRR